VALGLPGAGIAPCAWGGAYPAHAGLRLLGQADRIGQSHATVISDVSPQRVPRDSTGSRSAPPPPPGPLLPPPPLSSPVADGAGAGAGAATLVTVVAAAGTPVAQDTTMVTVLAAAENTTRAVVAGPRATLLAVKPCDGLHDIRKAPAVAHWATTVPPEELRTVPPVLAVPPVPVPMTTRGARTLPASRMRR
jgi:hypothetical protein